MSNDQIIEWVKMRVDLFEMRNGSPPYKMHVNDKLYRMLGGRQMWNDINVLNILPESDGYRMELWLGGIVSFEAVTSVPFR